jgi:AcrR family transcriptional regulator
MSTRQHGAPKARPSRRLAPSRKQDRHEQILAAAFEVFAVHGYEAARIDEVARRAGIAKGTVYLYFRDKEKLFQAVVRNLIPKRFDILANSFSGPPDVLLRELLSGMYTNIVRNEKVRSIVRMLVAESGRFPQLAEIYHQEVIVPGMKAMRQTLNRGIEEGVFHTSGAVEFPQIIAGPALTAMVWQLLFAERHPLDLDSFMKSHVEFVLLSLKRAGA